MTEHSLRRGLLWHAYERLAMVIGLGSLAVICLSWLPMAVLLHPILPQHVGRTVGRRVIMYAFRFYLQLLTWLCDCRFDLSELDRLRDAGPLIIAANHPSLLDAVLIASRLPDTVCVMKASLMDNILFGSAARLAHYIRNSGLMQIVTQSRQALQQGGQVLIFPEGTRTVDFPVNACTHTTGLMAKRTHTAVQTVLIEFSTPYLGKQWPLFRPPSLPLHCTIRLGRRFDAPANLETFTSELEQEFRRGLGRSTPDSSRIAA